MANFNSATVKAIRANLITIIKETIGWKFEDGSIDPDREDSYGASLDLGEFTPGSNHGEGPMYSAQSFDLQVNRKTNGKADHQLKLIDVTCEIEENITRAALNTGDLSASKLVSRREIDIRGNEPDSDSLVVSADIKVFFRDLRT